MNDLQDHDHDDEHDVLELTEQIAETDHFAVWKSAEESGTYYHIELGQVSLHLDSEEWDELVTLIKSVA